MHSKQRGNTLITHTHGLGIFIYSVTKQKIRYKSFGEVAQCHSGCWCLPCCSHCVGHIFPHSYEGTAVSYRNYCIQKTQKGKGFLFCISFYWRENVLQKISGGFPSSSIIRTGSYALALAVRMSGKWESRTRSLWWRWALPAIKGMRCLQEGSQPHLPHALDPFPSKFPCQSLRALPLTVTWPGVN